ncbi:MAG: TylF/MycF/NovP-related O-methyltransferase [Methylocella sp.]
MQYITDLIANIEEYPTRWPASFPELRNEQGFWQLYEKVRPYSMVHATGFYNAYESINYLKEANIEGAIVECGCFLGGMTAFMALVRNELRLAHPIYAFDTFEGFPEGSTDSFLGTPVGGPQYANFREAVQENILKVVGSLDRINLVQGRVEVTIPAMPLENIALLRLDTDHYDSTIVELKHYYPRMALGGVLIVDDYGLYDGSRKATDEFLATLQRRPLLNRIDHAIWAGVKPG